MNQKNKILVIATAAFEGGALTILSQFLDSIPKTDKSNYIILISNKLSNQEAFSDFELYKIDTSKWLKRIYYDLYGYRKFIEEKKFKVALCINFQNIPARIGSLKQIVYMHQALPFYRYNWSVFKKSEAKFWLYSKFYSRFMKWNAKYANYFIVQSNWIRENLSEVLNFQKDDILVLKPGISAIFKANAVLKKHRLKSKNTYIYPAAYYIYKNHSVILDAFKCLGEEYLKNNAIEIIFTVPETSDLVNKVKEMQLQPYVRFVGNINHNGLNDYYSNVSGLLFPSKIESFGLPLIEGACKGLQIIAADLPYAREAVCGYEKVFFAEPDNASHWASLIKADIENKKQNVTLFHYEDDWGELLSFIERNKSNS